MSASGYGSDSVKSLAPHKWTKNVTADDTGPPSAPDEETDLQTKLWYGI